MCLAAPGKEQLRTRLFFGRVAMTQTQSWELNIFLTCHSNTKKGSEKCRARRNMGPGCPDSDVWRDKCDNHTFESSERSWRSHLWPRSRGRWGVVTSLCGGSSLWSAVGSVTSWLSISCGITFAVGFGGAQKVERGLRGSGALSWAQEWNSRRPSSRRCLPCRELSCAVAQGCFLLTNSTMKWPLTAVTGEISRCSWYQLKCNDYNDAGGTETQFQLMQERNNLFSAYGFSFCSYLRPEFDSLEGAAVWVCWCLEWGKFWH